MEGVVDENHPPLSGEEYTTSLHMAIKQVDRQKREIFRLKNSKEWKDSWDPKTKKYRKTSKTQKNRKTQKNQKTKKTQKTRKTQMSRTTKNTQKT